MTSGLSRKVRAARVIFNARTPFGSHENTASHSLHAQASVHLTKNERNRLFEPLKSRINAADADFSFRNQQQFLGDRNSVGLVPEPCNSKQNH